MNKCDHCNNKFDPSLSEYDGEVLICGHSYHYECFEILEKSCEHCIEFYKKGIIDNVKSFVKRLEKDEDILMEDELENQRENNNENDENSNDQESIDNLNINEEIIDRMLINAKNEINYW
jgi:hypothetical protein